MSVGYTKLFSEIIMSTVWREPDYVRIVWITMLALKDRWHVVNASLPGLADAARVSLEDCEKALQTLSSPDQHSRSFEYEGRRIEPCDGGWMILNGEKYRNKMSLDERREYQRIKQREYRTRVKSCQQKGQQLTHTEADTDTEASSNTYARSRFVKPSLSDVSSYCQERGNRVDPQAFIDHYTSNGWKVGRNQMKDWKAAVRTWEKRDYGTKDNRSRAKRFSDKLDDIARRDIEKNGHTDKLD